MSYNIDTCDVRVLDAKMKRTDIRRLLSEEWIPEDNFLSDHYEAPAPGGWVTLTAFQWRGEGSGNGYHDTLLPLVCPLIKGHVEVIFTWEGGDSHSGLIVRDGVAIECDVVLTLVPKGSKS